MKTPGRVVVSGAGAVRVGNGGGDPARRAESAFGDTPLSRVLGGVVAGNGDCCVLVEESGLAATTLSVACLLLVSAAGTTGTVMARSSA